MCLHCLTYLTRVKESGSGKDWTRVEGWLLKERMRVLETEIAADSLAYAFQVP
jgi:hypothetical protein